MNKRRQHQEMVDSCCGWLARFGYLRPTDVARLLYKDKSSARRMAQRLLADMHSKGLLLRRQDTLVEEAHYALSEAGARHAFNASGMPVKSGKDLLRTVTGHRDAANVVCIEAILEGMEVATDREIQTSHNRVFNGKSPDALIIEAWEGHQGEGQRDYKWVEVENCRRHPKDLEKLAHWLVNVAFPTRGLAGTSFLRGYLQKVVIVISSRYASTIEARLREALTRITTPDHVAVLFELRLEFINQLAK